MARDARRNLARLDADSGLSAAALGRYDALIASGPDDLWSRRARRIRLLLRLGRPDLAEVDLGSLLDRTTIEDRGPILAERAAARLARNRPLGALEDANQAARLDPSPANARLIGRARLAAGQGLPPGLDHPDAFDGWPDGGAPLKADLRTALGRIGPDDHRTRAVLLSAIGDHDQAIGEADRLVALAPRSPTERLLRARIRHRASRLTDALADLAAGLAEAPEYPDLTELRGIIRVELGETENGLTDLRVARARGDDRAVGPRMAQAYLTLGTTTAGGRSLVQADP